MSGARLVSSVDDWAVVVEPDAEADADAEANEAPPVTDTCTEALSCCSFMTVVVYTQSDELVQDSVAPTCCAHWFTQPLTVYGLPDVVHAVATAVPLYPSTHVTVASKAPEDRSRLYAGDGRT